MSFRRIVACMAGALALATVMIQPTDAASTYSSITNAVQAYVQKDATARHFTLISVTLAGPQVQQTGTTVTLSYAVTTTHTLDVASADDWPAVKGIENFLANNPRLSAAAQSSVQQLLDSWKTRIQGYIDNPFTSNETIVATASVDSSGDVVPGTIQVFFVNPDGSMVPEAQALADIPSSGTVDSRFASLAASTAQQSSVSPDCLPGGGCPYNAYNAPAAYQYADNYVTQCKWRLGASCGTNLCTAPGDGEFPYPYTINGTTYNGYNPSYWFNKNCDDCANFVSQAMAQGGIPEVQGVWSEPADGQTEGTTDWVNATDLANYMTTATDSGGIPYWSQLSSMSYVVQGDVLYHYVGPGTGHVMMEVYGDGTSSAWDEHTNDGWHVGVDPTTYESTFYHVSDWRN